MEKPDGAAGQAAIEPDDLVVAIPHLRAVQAGLEHLPGTGVKAILDGSDERLGLARLKLPHLQADAARLRQDADLVQAMDHARRSSGLDGPVPDLDLVMFVLRRQFAQAHHGWTPVIGKNRRVHAIHGFPEIVGGGKGFPEPSTGRSIRIRRSPSVVRPVRVGILDTGIYPHPLLHGSYRAAEGSMLDGSEPRPQSAGHATFVAGLILQQAPDAELDVRWVLNDKAVATAWDVAGKMAQLVGSGIDIVNLSWGCRTADGQPPLVLARAVELLSPDIVIVAAAGNHPAGDAGSSAVPPSMPTYPAALVDVVAVGATNPDGSEADFNPSGAWMDMLALGVNVESTYLEGAVQVTRDPRNPTAVTTTTFDGYATWSGTSFAAAVVTGKIAAGTMSGRRSATEALHEMLSPEPGRAGHRARPVPTH